MTVVATTLSMGGAGTTRLGGLTFTVTGAVAVDVDGPLSVVGSNTAGGAISVKTTDASTAGQNLVFSAGANLVTTSGDVTLRSGDDLDFPSSARIQTPGQVAIYVDDGSADVGGAHVLIAGDIDSASVAIYGGAEADAFWVTPDQDLSGPGALLTPYLIHGNDPTTSPGDTLTIDATGIGTPTLGLVGGANSGAWSFGGAAAGVTYDGIEGVGVTGAASCYNLLLNMSLAGLDTTPDDIDTIAIATPNSGADLQITVDGSQLFRGAISPLCSLIVVGSNDDDRVDYSATAGPLSATLSSRGSLDGFSGSVTLPVAGGGSFTQTFDNIDRLVGSAAAGSSPATGDELMLAIATAATWNIAAMNGGSLTIGGPARDLDFAGFENLAGTNAVDQFLLADGAGLSGRLSAGGPTGASDPWVADLLDYSA
ncbi:MAG TPA: hypothetical protein PLV92_25725, partial [Pirellulaceae bacterium]|nr:hypothetical protein [Pirellulaceae bacterium]